MFIRPQHFQTAQRYWAHLVDRSGKWDVHYNWGLRSIQINLEALANYRLDESRRAAVRAAVLDHFVPASRSPSTK